MKKSLLFLLSLWFISVGLWAQTNMPNTDGGQQTVNVTAPVTFFDAGGETGNIPTYKVTGITFVPKAGEKIQITFETIDLQGGALVKIFDGAKALENYYDEIDNETTYTIPAGHKTAFSSTKTNETVVSESADGKLTVCFQNANGTGAGWKATVTSVPGNPLPADEVRITTTPAVKQVGNTPLNFYDDGGKNGKITQNFDGKITFIPTDASKRVKIDFTKVAIFYNSSAVGVGKQDILNVYNGTETTPENLLETVTNQPIVVKSTAADGSLTVTLKSKTGMPADGFEALVTQFEPVQMTFNTVELAQITTPNVCAGDKSQAILSVNIKTTNDKNPLIASKFTLNANGTFANIGKATLYYTGKNNVFTTTQKVGETLISADAFEINCTVPQALTEGDNYFWLAYDLKDNAVEGQIVDAGCTAVTVSGSDQSVSAPQPDGARMIKNEYLSTIGNVTKTVFGSWTYTHTPNPYGSGYKKETGDQIVTFLPGTSGKIMEINFQDFDVYYATTSYGVKAKFQIFSGTGITGEKLWEADATNKSTGPGKTLRSKSADGALTVVFNANDNMSYNAKGWHATVSEYQPVPMTVASVNAFQTNTDILKPGAVNQEIIGVEIVTAGDQTPLSLNELTINLKNSFDKIKKISVFSTGSEKTFATTQLIAEKTAPTQNELTLMPAEAFTFAEGKNYFWVAYDMNDALAAEQAVDAALVNIKTSGATQTPTNGDPDGARITKNIYEFQNGTNTVNVTSSLMFYDNGGATNKYTNAAKGTVRFVPKAGEAIKLIFKSFATNYADNFFVFNGNSTANADQLTKISGTKTGLPDILSTADDGSLTIKFEPTKTAAGWEIEVQSYMPLPLTVSSVKSTAVSTDKLLRGAQNELMLKVEVTVTGDKGNINLSQFAFSPENTTHTADFAQVNLYATGTEDAFSPANKYAESLTATPFIFSGNTAITKAGVYKFWLACHVAQSAIINNVLAAKLTTAKQDEILLTVSENETASRTVQAGFSGTYTIGASSAAHYKTFAQAITAMSGGIDGKVVFEIENGTYTEKIAIPNIPGASAENTITFKSKSGQYGDVIIQHNNYSEPAYSEDKMFQEYGVFTFEGADFITLEAVSVTTTDKKYPSVIHIKNMSQNVTVRNCNIFAPMTTTYSEDINLVYMYAQNIANKNNDFFTLENCRLTGGYIGASIGGAGYASLPKERGAKITGNTFTGQGSKAIYLKDEEEAQICNNSISNNQTAKSDFNAVDVFRGANGLLISANKIQLATKNTATAIVLRPSIGTTEKRVRVVNNSINFTSVSGASYGVKLISNCAYTDIAHNTISLKGSSNSSGGLFVDGNSESCNIENNIIQNEAGGYVYRVNKTNYLTSEITFSNNALYTSGSKFAYAGSDVEAFDAWKAVSSETNSIVEKVDFLSLENLDLKSAGNLRTAKPLSFVTTDINGAARNTVTPTIGAYEYAEIAMPAMAEGFPQVVNITHNSATAKIKLTENGKVFVLVKKAGETAPAQAEILAGESKNAAKNTEVDLAFTGLESLTEYKVYFVLQSLNNENSPVIATETFKTVFTPTQVSTFETVTATEGEFTDGTARFSGFKVVAITDGQGANNKKAAQLQTNGVIAITHNSDGLILNGFYLKSDAAVSLTAKKGTEEKGQKTFGATGGKWVFINLKELAEITSVTLAGTGTTLIDNFSGTPQPITFMLENKTANQGETVTIDSDIYGGVLPYTYAWTNAKNETVSTDAAYSFQADHTRALTLTVTDAWGSSAKWKSLVTVTGTAAVATFDDLYLAPETRWWGDEESGAMTSVFYSGSYSFTNTLVKDMATWGGFGYSNKTSTAFNSLLTDQFNSAVGHGVNKSENYAVAYTQGSQTKVTVTNNSEGEVISGFYITNNAWVKDVSVKGTGMASTDDPIGKKPFGTGDWYKITAKGDNGNALDFYLADYRDANTANHYTLDTWQWFDLRSLGKVKYVTFKADGTRKNEYGSTIPFYFCMDDFGGMRIIKDVAEQSVQLSKTKNVALTDLFETSTLTGDVSYKITDNINATLGTAVIENGVLKLNAIAEGKSEIVVQKTVKGHSFFVKIPVSFTVSTGIDNTADYTLKVTVYPNPASDYITINTGGKVEIFTLNGIKVYENARYTIGKQINISDFTNGVYFVKINNRTVKLIKR